LLTVSSKSTRRQREVHAEEARPAEAVGLPPPRRRGGGIGGGRGASDTPGGSVFGSVLDFIGRKSEADAELASRAAIDAQSNFRKLVEQLLAYRSTLFAEERMEFDGAFIFYFVSFV
jgi:hypothetical protein